MLKFTAFLLWLLCSAANAQTYTAVGAHTCDQWTNGNQLVKARARSWLAGYLTAANSMTTQMHGPDFLKDPPESKLWAWMDRYCKEHPKDAVGDGAPELVDELLRNLRTGR